MEGLQEWNTPQGIHVLRVHYTADPEKRSAEWRDREMAGSSPRDWEQEMEINFEVPLGKPFYPEFRESFHVAAAPLSPLQGRPILRGWDFGLSPATAFLQSTPKGQIMVLYPELQSWDTGITRHGQLVANESAAFFPGFSFSDYGDPAGAQKAQTDERTCFDLLRSSFGFHLQPGPVARAAREEPMRDVLTSMTAEGEPCFLVDPRCDWARSALRGGYCRKMVGERMLDEPEKNEYSHFVDALVYVVAMTWGKRERQSVKMPKAGEM